MTSLSRLAKTIALVFVFLASPAWAVRVTNLTTSSLLFEDDFESAPSVSSIPYPDLSGDYDPVANTGNWVIGGPAITDEEGGSNATLGGPEDIQVTNSTTSPDPGPFKGSNYLRIQRQNYLSAAWIDLNASNISNGDSIRLDSMVATGSTNNSNPGFIFYNGSDIVNIILMHNDGGVYNRANGQNYLPTGLTHALGEWSHVVVDYTVGSSTFDLTVDGYTVSGLGIFAGTAPTDITGIRFNGAASEDGNGDPTGNLGQMYLDSAPLITATIDRDTVGNRGNLKLTSNNGSPVTILGYSFTSAGGALDPTSWTSIASTYDADDGGIVDGNDEWTELTHDAYRTDLSEFESGAVGDGATLTDSQTIDLGDVWIKNLTEDVRLEILLDNGSTYIANLDFIGAEIVEYDLNFDGMFDADDFFEVFAPNYLTDTSEMSDAEKYQAGDFNEDGLVDATDFFTFNDAYLAANEGAASLSLSAVPEPTSCVLLALSSLALVARRRGSKRPLRIPNVFFTSQRTQWEQLRLSLIVIATVATSLLASQAGADLVIHTDPNSLSNMFQDGGSAGGTIDVNGTGDPVGWINDLVSGFDLQQAGTDAKPTVAVGPKAGSPYVTNFDGGDNLLLIGDYFSGNILGPTTELDGDTLTVILAASVDAAGTGTRSLIDLSYDGSTASVVGIDYDHTTGELVGRVAGGSVSTAVSEDTWFIAELVWDSSNGVSLSVNGALAATGAASAASSTEFYRMRYGTTVAGTVGTYLIGSLGDVYIYDSAAEDTTALVAQLVNDYVPDPPLSLQVNKFSGAARLINTSGDTTTIDFYRIRSSMNSLAPGDWTSLDSQNLDGDLTWGELGTAATELSEGYFSGSSDIADGTILGLGNIYTGGNNEDLVFDFRTSPDKVLRASAVLYVEAGDMNGDGNVDAMDVPLFVQALVNRAAYESAYPEIDADFVGDFDGNGLLDTGDIAAFSLAAAAAGSSESTAVPEPASALLLVLTTCCLVGMNRQQRPCCQTGSEK